MTLPSVIENHPALVTSLAEEVFQNRHEAANRLRAYVENYQDSPLSTAWSSRADAVESAQSSGDLSRTSDQIRFLPFLTGRSSVVPLDHIDNASPWMLRWDRWFHWIYPIATMIAALVVVTFILVFVVPDFDAMFDEFALRLPPPTMLLIQISRVVRLHPLGLATVIALMVTIGVLARIAWRRLSPSASFVRDRREELNQAAMLADSMAAWIESGTSVQESIQLAGLGSDDDRVREFLWQIGERMPFGYSPNRLGIQRVVPPTLAHAISQPSPNIESIRMYASLYRSRAVTRSSSWVAVFLPYVVIVFLGLFIGFLVFALFAPLVSLISGLTGY